MNVIGKRHIKKYIGFGIITIILIVSSIIVYHDFGEKGIIYVKGDEGKEVYEFVEDLNNDGKNEKIVFSNHYSSYYLENACDSEYTNNYIKIYIDGKVKYKIELTTLGPLLNPQIIGSSEEIGKMRQLYVHDDGGGPAPPMDCYFYYKGDELTSSQN